MFLEFTKVKLVRITSFQLENPPLRLSFYRPGLLSTGNLAIWVTARVRFCGTCDPILVLRV
jgi:hypothetical protein